MAKGQRLKPEQIVTLLRQIDVLTSNGKTLISSNKSKGTTDINRYSVGGLYLNTAINWSSFNLNIKRIYIFLSIAPNTWNTEE